MKRPLYFIVLYGILLVLLTDAYDIFMKNPVETQVYDTYVVFLQEHVTLVKILFLAAIACIYFWLKNKNLNRRLAKFHIFTTVFTLILIKILYVFSLQSIARRYYKFETFDAFTGYYTWINSSLTVCFIVLFLVQFILLFFVFKVFFDKLTSR